ncbi:zinc finger protein 782-like [Homalodisca vitripennis]|uniref:zinc finger protein 782-like n=1 Tax=Homalodisca vitripennis TaxID=197043 RepID=UPI001EEB3022|nr:zinc finger protein 782-like [Homalodisca vitripennis]
MVKRKGDEEYCKRDTLPRRAKEQSVINLEKLAVIMEVIDVSSAVDDAVVKDEKTKKKKVRLKKRKKPNIDNAIDATESDILLSSLDQEDVPDQSKKTSDSSLTVKSTTTNSTGFSLFMELEERRDLLCNSPVTDPLGPDSFDSFQWVEVKQELPEDVEVSKITLTELPLKVDAVTEVDVEQIASEKSPPPVEVPLAPVPPDDQREELSVSEEEDSENDDWGQDSCIDDSSSEPDNRKSEENVLKKKRKNHPQDCDICGKKLSSRGSLRLHKLNKHKQKMQFSCELCGMKFDFQREVVKHRNDSHRQEDGLFCCEICSKRLPDYHSFLVHVKSHIKNCKEEEGSDKVCKECGKSFQDENSLKIHITLIHRMEVVGLRKNLKTQEKNFICDTCGKRFAFNCLLQDHINLHTGLKPYCCHKCGKSFSQKATLKQHTKTHSDVRPFQCAECSLGFYGRGDLMKHIRKHTGERPYVCEMCGEGFSRSGHLGVHRRSHTGERPYSCDVCGRAFTKRGDVVRHRRIHTGELPYLCQVCGKSFRQSTQCANHIKSQHPDNLMPVFVAKNPTAFNQRMESQFIC